jgi:transcription elongation factor GreA
MEKYITREGLEKLKKELEDLEINKRREIAKRLQEAAAMGDLSDNAQYQETRREQSFLEGRILELKNIIRNAKIIKKDETKNGLIKIGSSASLKVDGLEQKLMIIGESESRPLEGKISYQSPLGRSLLEKKEGDIFEFEAPGGTIKVEILKVEEG